MRINTSKDTFLVLEGIQITYWVENTGIKSEYYRGSEIKELIVRDIVTGGTIDCGLTMVTNDVLVRFSDSSIGYGDWMFVEPGASIWKYPSDLLSGMTVDKPFRCNTIPPGTYMIYSKSMNSDTVTITVREPANERERQEVEQFNIALALGQVHARIFRKDHEAALEDFINSHPQSLLLPRALGELRLSEQRVASFAAKRLILEYPHTVFAALAVEVLDVSLLSESERLLAKTHLMSISQSFQQNVSIVKSVSLKLNELKE